MESLVQAHEDRLGHLYCLVNYLTKGKCLFTFCKVALAPEMDRGGKPAFYNIYGILHKEWDLIFSEIKNVLEKGQ